MPKSNPFALLISAGSDSNTSIDRLLRGALIAARTCGDSEFAAWLSSELDGYSETRYADLPEYRKVTARLVAVDRMGNHLPAVVRDPAAAKHLLVCPLAYRIAELARMADASPDSEYLVSFTPEMRQRVLKAFQGAIDVYRIVQRGSIESALIAVRQRVLAWATNRITDPLELPGGLSLESILGTRLQEPIQSLAAPIEANDASAVNFNLSGLVNSQVIVNSPHTSATASQTTGVEAAALVALISELTAGVERARRDGASTDAVEEQLDRLKALGQMQAPPRDWLRQAAGSVKLILEQAAGSVLGNIATPQVQALLAQLLHT